MKEIEYANDLLRQAESNEIWAVLSTPSKAKKLRSVAKKMLKEASRILDQHDQGYANDFGGTDEELLALLGD